MKVSRPVKPEGGSRRNERTAATRAAIASAALDVFVEHGFAAARMDDVALRAGVAKGTLYLHYDSKEALFEAIVADTIVPVLDDLRTLASDPDETARDFAERVLVGLWRRVRVSGGAKVVHLVFAEAPRFPGLAETYHRAVIGPGLDLIRSIARRADGQEARAAAVERFPQLLIAPILVALFWDLLFARFEPLEAEAMLRTQLDLVFGPPSALGDQGVAKGLSPSAMRPHDG